jgi:hypothetical protein
MRIASILMVCVLLPSIAAPVVALNAETTFVLHAIESSFGPCSIDDPCPGATVDVAIGTTIAAYLVVANHDDLVGLQTAFDWGDWTFLFGLWDCQENQVNGTTPAPPGGPTAGTIATVFDCVTGGGSIVVGRLHLTVTGAGCLSQVESTYPFGGHVVACGGAIRAIDPVCRGTICAPEGGFDACSPCSPGPVEPSTWGRLKAAYTGR